MHINTFSWTEGLLSGEEKIACTLSWFAVDQQMLDDQPPDSDESERLLQEGNLLRRSQPRSGYKLFHAAVATAKKHGSWLLHALALNQLAGSCDQLDNSMKCLDESADSLRKDIELCQDELLQARAKPRRARKVLGPRLELLEVIEQSRDQYQLVIASIPLRKLRFVADMALIKHEYVQAESAAAKGEDEAVKLFGYNHWWRAVFLIRLATARLYLQGKSVQAHEHCDAAHAVLSDWDSQTFAAERKLLASVARNIPRD